MDWRLALQHKHETLLRIAAGLFALLGLEVGQSVETLPRYQRSVVFMVLRPAESTLRRLLVVAAFVYEIVAPPTTNQRTRPSRPMRKSAEERSERMTILPFRLIDPRKKFDLFPNRPKNRRIKGPGPFISDPFDPESVAKRQAHFAEYERRILARLEDPNAKTLCHRLNSLMAALQDLPGQALRMAKLQARIDQRQKSRGKPILRPLRPGAPPGHRYREKHEVDALLKECELLARWVLNGTGPPLEPQ